jgi:hypothetical protein
MNEQQQQALNAAILAKMVGSEMSKVDELMIDRSSTPNNRIDINKFIAPITGKQPIQNQANQGYVSEAIVQRMVPDSPSTPPPPLPVQAPPPAPAAQSLATSDEDIKAIKGHLERISSNLTKLTGMFGKIYCNVLEKENKKNV